MACSLEQPCPTSSADSISSHLTTHVEEGVEEPGTSSCKNKPAWTAWGVTPSPCPTHSYPRFYLSGSQGRGEGPHSTCPQPHSHSALSAEAAAPCVAWEQRLPEKSQFLLAQPSLPTCHCPPTFWVIQGGASQNLRTREHPGARGFEGQRVSQSRSSSESLPAARVTL